jgi:hypothetical protein
MVYVAMPTVVQSIAETLIMNCKYLKDTVVT